MIFSNITAHILCNRLNKPVDAYGYFDMCVYSIMMARQKRKKIRNMI
jgi:hypothetical protein